MRILILLLFAIVCHLQAIEAGPESSLVTGEIVMEHELERHHRMKPTLQLSVSQPVHHIHGKGRRQWKPNLTLKFGFDW